MKAEAFLKGFAGVIVSSHLITSDIPTEDGVRLFTPVPQKAGNYVFLGDISTFLHLVREQKLITRSTYLICKGADDRAEFCGESSWNINYILLNLKVKEAVQLLNILQNDTQKECPDGTKVLQAFFKAISVENISSHELMTSWVNRFPYPLKTFIACVVVRSEYPVLRYDYVQEVTNALHDFFPETNLFYMNKEWIVFWGQEVKGSGELDISYEAFAELLQRYGLNAGISYLGVIPENMYTLYLTAKAAMMLGLKVNVPPRIRRIYSFAQYHQLYLIHLCAKEYERVHNHSNFYYMAHPDIVRIFLHDQEHGTDLLDTLYAYLINQSSLTRTAQFLYMHRNTVYNKLLKIEALIGYPLNKIQDHSIFILSYMVVKYYCEYQNNVLI